MIRKAGASLDTRLSLGTRRSFRLMVRVLISPSHPPCFDRLNRPISRRRIMSSPALPCAPWRTPGRWQGRFRSEEHTSELQSHVNLVCRLLLEKKKKKTYNNVNITYNQKRANDMRSQGDEEI